LRNRRSARPLEDLDLRRIASGLGIAAVLLALVAVPALATKPDKDHVEKTSITIKGTVEVAANADGADVYSLKAGGKTYQLEAGPPWFFGDKYPLKPFVGKNVTIVGEIAEGSTEVDVESVDGTALRAPGRPPWAGGWRAVGATHPGWSQAKADRMREKFGDCFPPGHCKDKPGHAKGAGGAEEPEGSEAPD
jgi:hypothetical protein